MILLAASIYYDMMTSTIPGKIDWNIYDASSGDIEYIRWLSPEETHNVIVYSNMSRVCWTFDGTNSLPCTAQ